MILNTSTRIYKTKSNPNNNKSTNSSNNLSRLVKSLMSKLNRIISIIAGQTQEIIRTQVEKNRSYLEEAKRKKTSSQQRIMLTTKVLKRII